MVRDCGEVVEIVQVVMDDFVCKWRVSVLLDEPPSMPIGRVKVVVVK